MHDIHTLLCFAEVKYEPIFRDHSEVLHGRYVQSSDFVDTPRDPVVLDVLNKYMPIQAVCRFNQLKPCWNSRVIYPW